MKKILILQFRVREKTFIEERVSFMKVLSKLPVQVVFKNAFLDALDWSKPIDILEDSQAVILGGSGEYDFDGGRKHDDEVIKASHDLVEHMSPFLTYLEDYDFPTLAICFGHQILAKSCGVSVINDKTQSKVGSHTVSLTDEAKNDRLFEGIPSNFIAQYGHKVSLSALPSGGTLLAQGEQCFFSAIRFGRNRYSLQFHPELDASDVLQKFISHPDYLPPGLTPHELVQESPYSTQILINFVNKVSKNLI